MSFEPRKPSCALSGRLHRLACGSVGNRERTGPCDVDRVLGLSSGGEVLPDDHEPAARRIAGGSACVDGDECRAVADEPAVVRLENLGRDRHRGVRGQHVRRNPVGRARRNGRPCRRLGTARGKRVDDRSSLLIGHRDAELRDVRSGRARQRNSGDDGKHEGAEAAGDEPPTSLRPDEEAPAHRSLSFAAQQKQISSDSTRPELRELSASQPPCGVRPTPLVPVVPQNVYSPLE